MEVNNKKWYLKSDRNEKLIKNFNLEVSYNLESKKMYIGTENSSGAKYICNDIDDVKDAIENYIFIHYFSFFNNLKVINFNHPFLYFYNFLFNIKTILIISSILIYKFVVYIIIFYKLIIIYKHHKIFFTN